MGNIDELETIAIKMIELYARETNTNYNENLKDKLYQFLRKEI